jgi:uncharacterized membrane protein YkvA (DUF1232 family)
VSATTWLVVAGAAVALYALAVLALVLAGRRAQAVAIARLIPDALVLVQRLARDERVPRRTRWILAAVALYLVVPIDLVPDFVPVAGQLDDALVVGLALRAVLRAAGPEVVEDCWPGPPEGLALVRRIAGDPSRAGGS